MVDKKVIEYWEHCGLTYAHLIDTIKKSEIKLYNSYEINLLQYLELRDKVVIDYGIGGGFLGKLLFEKYNIQKYIGFDIAKRSIEYARDRLIEYEQCELCLVDDYTQFKTYNADIFISFACIQHFPTIEYLIHFLMLINTSNIDIIALHIRYNDDTICNNSYINNGNVGLACCTNSTFILRHINNYILHYASDIQQLSKAQFLIFKKKK